MEILENIDEQTKNRMRLVSIDSPDIREYVKEFITEVPCMVIKEGGKRYICDYNTLKETFPPNTTKVRFSSTEASGVNVGKKLDMNSVREEMKRREQETKDMRPVAPTIDSLASSNSSVMSQYMSNSKENIKPEVNTAANSQNDINDFFKYEVVGGSGGLA